MPSFLEDPEFAWSLDLTNMFIDPICTQFNHSLCQGTHVNIHCFHRTSIDILDDVFFLPGGGDGCRFSQVYHPGL